MGNKYLKEVYKLIFNEEFSYSEFTKRLKMQKAIYLMQEKGIPIGDYGFSWYKHGPYSQELLDDMYLAKDPNVSWKLAKDYSQAFESIITTINENNNTDIALWIESLASIHYLMENVLSTKSTKNEVITELIKRKPHLNQDGLPEKAYDSIKSLFS